MGFFRSILTLMAVCMCIAFAYAVGHGLSAHSNKAFIIGFALLLGGAAMLAGLTRDRARP
ncbi:MAG: hypothetical protein WD054_00295 [Gemmatimonadota bacterium]